MRPSKGPAHLPLDTNLEFLSHIQDPALTVASTNRDFNEVFGSYPSGTMHNASSCTLADILHRALEHPALQLSWVDVPVLIMSAARALRHGGYEPPDFRFKGDHRGFFVDFDTNTLFGNDAPFMSPSASRNLVSNDRQNFARYVHAKYASLLEHRLFQRMSCLTQNSQPDHRLAESLDRDWLSASLR
jgi:hypothetical protein